MRFITLMWRMRLKQSCEMAPKMVFYHAEFVETVREISKACFIAICGNQSQCASFETKSSSVFDLVLALKGVPQVMRTSHLLADKVAELLAQEDGGGCNQILSYLLAPVWCCYYVLSLKC